MGAHRRFVLAITHPPRPQNPDQRTPTVRAWAFPRAGLSAWQMRSAVRILISGTPRRRGGFCCNGRGSVLTSLGAAVQRAVRSRPDAARSGRHVVCERRSSAHDITSTQVRPPQDGSSIHARRSYGAGAASTNWLPPSPRARPLGPMTDPRSIEPESLYVMTAMVWASSSGCQRATSRYGLREGSEIGQWPAATNSFWPSLTAGRSPIAAPAGLPCYLWKMRYILAWPLDMPDPEDARDALLELEAHIERDRRDIDRILALRLPSGRRALQISRRVALRRRPPR